MRYEFWISEKICQPIVDWGMDKFMWTQFRWSAYCLVTNFFVTILFLATMFIVAGSSWVPAVFTCIWLTTAKPNYEQFKIFMQLDKVIRRQMYVDPDCYYNKQVYQTFLSKTAIFSRQFTVPFVIMFFLFTALLMIAGSWLSMIYFALGTVSMATLLFTAYFVFCLTKPPQTKKEKKSTKSFTQTAFEFN